MSNKLPIRLLLLDLFLPTALYAIPPDDVFFGKEVIAIEFEDDVS